MPTSSPADWPSGIDLRAFLSNAKLTQGSAAAAIAEINADFEVKQAIKTFQKETGWTPFLGTSQTRVFNPPGPERASSGVFGGLGGGMGGSNRLFLHAGLLSVQSLAVGVTAANPTGTVLTQGRDFWLRPTEAPSAEEPYRQIYFRTAQYGDPESIHITGIWGFMATPTEDIFQAILKLAAWQVSPQIALSISQALLSRKAGDEEERFSGGRDAGPLSSESTRWKADYDGVAEFYRGVSAL